MDNIYTISVKGSADIFYNQCKIMDIKHGSKIIKFIFKTLWSSNRNTLMYSNQRGGSGVTTEVTSEDTLNVISAALCGVSEKHSINVIKTNDEDEFLGWGKRFSLVYGISQNDTGHVTILSTLPQDIHGCYTLSCNSVGKIMSGETKDRYHLLCDIEIYIKGHDMHKIKELKKMGFPIYPMAIEHPHLYPNSESEGTSQGEESEDEYDEEKNLQPLKSALKTQPGKEKGIMGTVSRLVKRAKPTGPAHDRSAAQERDSMNDNQTTISPDVSI